jgi:hypothetical protein
MRHGRALALLLICGTLLLPGCAPQQKELDFGMLLPSEWTPYETYRFDTNTDGIDEWAILYTYDQKTNQDFTPVGGVIYHADRGKPPIIFPYPLIAPGWSRLGEGKSSVRLEDLLSDLSGSEVVFQSVNGSGITTRVALFHWEDHEPDKLLPPTADPEIGQWYRCVGQFYGDAGIKLELNKATVWEHTQERSQLAIRKTYLPRQGSYVDGTELAPPVETCLDFAYGQPQEVGSSPYPEKVLMAFYWNFGTEQAYDLMTKEAAQELRTGANEWAYIAPWPFTSVTSACVKELNYNPGAEAQAQKAMIAQVQATHIARATFEAASTMTACPEPECTCPPTPNGPQASPPVWVTTRVEYRLHEQTSQMWAAWGLVQVDGVWRIDQVVSQPANTQSE